MVRNLMAVLQHRRWRWALAIALVSDLLGLALTLLPFVQWLLDGATALALLLVLGFQWPLLAALVVEVVPALEIFPTWTLAILAMSVTTHQDSPGDRS
jgi:hypothetical protein